METPVKGKQKTIDNEVRLALKSLGFTDYFVNIYIGLLENGEMNAHDLSKITKVPYSRIYEVLNDMVRREIIQKIEGRPSVFLSKDPPEIFKILKYKQDEDFNTNMNICLPYLVELFGDKKPIKKIEFTVYEGKPSFTDHLRNVINASARTLSIIIKSADVIIPLIKMNLDFIRTKGVIVRIIIEEKFRVDKKLASSLNRYGKMRYHPFVHQNLLVSDDKTALQSIKGHFNIAKPSEMDFALFTSNDNFYLNYMLELFDSFWEDAKE
jgi:HTH-type transcriptional regulator, sugar sensing transcriptional regulator